MTPPPIARIDRPRRQVAGGAPPQIGSPQVRSFGCGCAASDKLASSSKACRAGMPACVQHAVVERDVAGAGHRRQQAARSVAAAPSSSARVSASRSRMLGVVERVPIEHGGIARRLAPADRGFRRRAWHRPRRIPACGPARTASASSPLKVAEKRERLGRAPFLAHEQQAAAPGCNSNTASAAASASGWASDCQPFAHRPVADLVVVLQEVDEIRARQMRARLAARLAVAMRRGLALIGEAFGQRCARYARRASW